MTINIAEKIPSIIEFLTSRYEKELKENKIEDVIKRIIGTKDIGPFINEVLNCGHTTYDYSGLIVEVLTYFFKLINLDVKLIELRDYITIAYNSPRPIFDKPFILNKDNLEGFDMIKKNEFYDWQITEAILPDGLDLIQAEAFTNCSELTRIILPDSLQKQNGIGNSAFKNCMKLNKVIFPKTISRIRRSAFYGCGLIEIVLPNTIEILDNWAFMNCSNLTSITLPNSIKGIGANVFTNTKVTEINYLGTKNEWQSINKDLHWDSDSKLTTIKCTDGVINLKEKKEN